MPQALLPLVPDGVTEISDVVSVHQGGEEWTYFCGVMPVFRHPREDQASFRMFAAQLCVQGLCKQAEIVRTFGVSKMSVIRAVRKYREEGIGGFYKSRKGRGPSVMTAEVAARATELLNSGRSRKEVARELGLKYDTLRKAIDRGQVPEGVSSDEKKEDEDDDDGPPESPSTRTSSATSVPASDKSTRSDGDAAAGEEMGIACTRTCERVLASVGKLPGGASPEFEVCRDVSYGGVLCALPALSANGLFRHLGTLPSLSGYYLRLHVILLLACMALCRIKTVEQLQYESPGELGKLLGLDRIPEVRCLRKKLSELSEEDAPDEWAAQLSKDWMEEDPELAGTLYVDGHVRLYHGHLTKLPRRYVSRQRLCLRGTTDYWVNDALGQPFFYVERPIDHGMLEALRTDLVPRLLKDVPNQPTEQQLEADPHLCRFTIVFDREGYSPAFFREMWEKHRIACITYRKNVKDLWPESWFTETEVRLGAGEVVSLKLAEMGSWIGRRGDGLWVREVRKLTETGHQVSLVATAYGQLAAQNAGRLFSRWSQENFLRYMMQHFGIDALSEYGTEEISDTSKPVVNPARRELDRQGRSVRAKLTRRQACFAAATISSEAEGPEVKKWQRKKAALREEIEQFENELKDLNERKESTPTHLDWDDLPEGEKCSRLAPSRKRLTDTVKLVAYRAETAMATVVREQLSHMDDARSLLRDLFRSDADLIPDEARGVLEVRLHTLSNPRSNRAVQHLLEHLNAAEFIYPGTNFRLVYRLANQPSQ